MISDQFDLGACANATAFGDFHAKTTVPDIEAQTGGEARCVTRAELERGPNGPTGHLFWSGVSPKG